MTVADSDLPCYRASADAVLTVWAGDRLLVFSRHDENTHVLSPSAGQALDFLLSRDGAPFRASDIAGACADDAMLRNPEAVARLLRELHQAGIVEQCRSQ